MVSVFSDFEKNVINKMLLLDNEGSVVCLHNILADIHGILGTPADFDFCMESDEVFSLYYFKKLNISSSKDIFFMKETERILYDTVLLINYLIEEKYILLVDDISKKNRKKSEYSFNIPLEKDLQKRLCELWNKQMKVLLRLKTLKQHNYLEENLYESKKNTKYYILFTVISLFLSLVSIGVQVFLSYQVQKISIVSVPKSVFVEKVDGITIGGVCEKQKKDDKVVIEADRNEEHVHLNEQMIQKQDASAIDSGAKCIEEPNVDK